MQLNALIGKKNYQKQAFLQNGKRVPLTGVTVSGNVVAQIKTADKEGYNALQLGIETKKKANKSLVNHSKKAGLKNTPRFFREVRVDDLEGITAGMEINVADVFAAGDIIDVTGISKGKGWAGGVKRWGFHGGPRTHGQSDRERAPGSIGQTTTPGRVYRGKKMAGRMGQDTVTLKNLEVIEVTNDGVLLIKGLVPGSLNTVLIVKKVGQNKKFVPLYKEVVEEKVEDEALRSSQQSEESSNASIPASAEASDSGHGQTASDSSEDSSTAEAPRAKETNNEVESEANNEVKIETKEEKKEEVKENASK